MRPSTSSVLAVTLLVPLCLLSCRKDEATTQVPATSSGVGAPAAAAPSGAALAAARGPTCTVEREQVWGSGANLRTGITDTQLADGRLALGVAFGNRPAVLIVDGAGRGDLVRPAIAGKSPLATDLDPKSARRDLQRVTPASAPGGGVRVLADYRDKWEKEDRRRIVCGPADTHEPLAEFDGKPLLDVDTSGKDRALPVAKPSAVLPAAPADGGAEEPPPVVGDPEIGKKEKKLEVRDCRSIVDPGGEKQWALASELYGEPHADGDYRWTMRLTALHGPHRTRIWGATLGKNPKKLHTFENVVARRLEDGSYLVAARYQGALHAFLLSSKLERKAPMQVYRGGYPTIPRLTSDGPELAVLLSQKTGEDRYGLQWARVSLTRPALPAALRGLSFDAIDPSLAEPNLARLGEQRWLAVQAGPRQSARLVVVPVDETLAPVGPPLTVSAQGNVNESRLFALGGGKLLAVWLRQAGAGAELVSAWLACS